jgi:hypothetical protein
MFPNLYIKIIEDSNLDIFLRKYPKNMSNHKRKTEINKNIIETCPIKQRFYNIDCPFGKELL